LLREILRETPGLKEGLMDIVNQRPTGIVESLARNPRMMKAGVFTA